MASRREPAQPWAGAVIASRRTWEFESSVQHWWISPHRLRRGALKAERLTGLCGVPYLEIAPLGGNCRPSRCISRFEAVGKNLRVRNVKFDAMAKGVP